MLKYTKLSRLVPSCCIGELLARKGRVTVVDTLEYFSVGKGSMTDLVHKAEDATEVSTGCNQNFCPTLGHMGKNSLREVVV